MKPLYLIVDSMGESEAVFLSGPASILKACDSGGPACT